MVNYRLNMPVFEVVAINRAPTTESDPFTSPSTHVLSYESFSPVLTNFAALHRAAKLAAQGVLNGEGNEGALRTADEAIALINDLSLLALRSVADRFDPLPGSEMALSDLLKQQAINVVLAGDEQPTYSGSFRQGFSRPTRQRFRGR